MIIDTDHCGMDVAFWHVQSWEKLEENMPMGIVDPTLELSSDEEEEVLRVIKVAHMCVQEAPERRPSMAQVVAMLQGDLEVDGVEIQHQKSSTYMQMSLAVQESGLGMMEEYEISDQTRLQTGPSSSSIELCSIAHTLDDHKNVPR